VSLRRRGEEHDMFRHVHVGLHSGVAVVSSIASVEFIVLRNECAFVSVARRNTAALNRYTRE
jgi:hypothetical protein